MLMLVILACLLSSVMSTPLLGRHNENPKNILVFPGVGDAKVVQLDRSINNMGQKNDRTVVNSNGFLSKDNITTASELRTLLNAYLSGATDDNIQTKIEVLKMRAIIKRFSDLKSYFRELHDPRLEKEIQAVLRKGFEVNFVPDQILTGTWNQFCPLSVNSKEFHDLVKTFKCILAVAKKSTYAIFISDDNDPCLSTHLIPKEDVVPTESKHVRSDKIFLDPLTSEGVMTFSTFEPWNMTTKTEVTPSSSVGNVPSNSSNPNCFQLKYRSWCLILTPARGYLGTCGRNNLFYYSGYPGNQRIYYPYANQCLDSQSCHSSTSNVRYSTCNHCGAIHWDVRSDGTLREDRGANCIYIRSGNTAYIHRSTLSCASFRKIWTSC